MLQLGEWRNETWAELFLNGGCSVGSVSNRGSGIAVQGDPLARPLVLFETKTGYRSGDLSEVPRVAGSHRREVR